METSTSIMKGAKGDIALLKPTQMCAVPLVLDRIYKGIQSKIEGSGAAVSALFNHAVNYRIKWEAKGYTTPLLDKYFFGAVRNLTGGMNEIILFLYVNFQRVITNLQSMMNAKLSPHRLWPYHENSSSRQFKRYPTTRVSH